jgi:hypothetical protein
MAPERKRRERDREKRKIEEERMINRGRVILEKKNDSQATGRTHESFSRERERERVEGKKRTNPEQGEDSGRASKWKYGGEDTAQNYIASLRFHVSNCLPQCQALSYTCVFHMNK